ncbi:prepilin peptidase [Lentzea cavernae]|uniref:Prepilin type IV endopeptidase peptidase domain-containing protein n=1 Tax=Lentzea cavernae TaxID=2020703 RepID=A0ABQ3MW84_9PSEU|nr:prepilin peptidase [Lentzea cavernae]GHH62490.1 hypothetical protein GCM10017774_90390 [Lentzea cavernae]
MIIMLLSYLLLGIISGPMVVLTGFAIARREPVSWQVCGSVGWPTLLAASVFLGSVLICAVHAVPRSAGLVAWLVIIGLVLALVDWTCQRLPHFLVGTLFAGGFIQMSLMAIAVRDAVPLLRAGGAAALAFVVGLLVYVISGGGLGFGDVTLVTALSLLLGWHGWPYVALGLLSGLAGAGVATQALLLMKRIRPREPIALGPALLLGALFSILQA